MSREQDSVGTFLGSSRGTCPDVCSFTWEPDPETGSGRKWALSQSLRRAWHWAGRAGTPASYVPWRPARLLSSQLAGSPCAECDVPAGLGSPWTGARSQWSWKAAVKRGTCSKARLAAWSPLSWHRGKGWPLHLARPPFPPVETSAFSPLGLHPYGPPRLLCPGPLALSCCGECLLLPTRPAAGCPASTPHLAAGKVGVDWQAGRMPWPRGSCPWIKAPRQQCCTSLEPWARKGWDQGAVGMTYWDSQTPRVPHSCGARTGALFLGQHLPDFCKRTNLPRNWDRRQAIWGPPCTPKVAGGRVLACVPLPIPDPTRPRAHLSDGSVLGSVSNSALYDVCITHTQPHWEASGISTSLLADAVGSGWVSLSLVVARTRELGGSSG